MLGPVGTLSIRELDAVKRLSEDLIDAVYIVNCDYQVIYVNPAFPREILALYVGLFVAVLTALGVNGVTSVAAKTNQIMAARVGEEAARELLIKSGIPLEPGQLEFEAFSIATGKVDWNGQPIPPWRELNFLARQAWVAVANASASKRIFPLQGAG